jgi:phosphatidylinositol alpha-mannosyltransferase
MPASWLVSIGTRCLGWFLHRNLKRFDATLSVSTAAQRFSHQAFDIASQVVPNTAPFEHFYHAKPFMEYKDVQTVVFLGRLVERKGCQHLLAAVAKLNRDGTWPDKTKVVVCGSGPLELKLTAFVHEQGLTEIVEFKGFISEADKPRYLASADVAIFPSTGGESFGIVLIEAMAASRGVVLAGHNPGYASVMHAHPEVCLTRIIPLHWPNYSRKHSTTPKPAKERGLGNKTTPTNSTLAWLGRKCWTSIKQRCAKNLSEQ